MANATSHQFNDNMSVATEHADEEASVATEHAEKVPVIEIAFKNGMWWALPQEMSQALYDKYLANETDIGYTWDWGDSQSGSWKPDDEETTINRYLLDFEAGLQRNIDNNRHRTMCVVWVHPSSTGGRWTGQIAQEPGFNRS